jgi:PPOX class probable FMN-dependent enzyme
MPMSAAPFQQTVSTIEELRTLYRQPHQLVVAKERPTLDAATTTFLTKATFAVVSTFGADGGADASPRGGPSGFIQVLDEHRLAIGDLGGNNRLDTIENIVTTGQIGILAVHPGKSETVRVNGRAWITRDPEILGRFPYAKPPITAIAVEVVGTYIHCAKAFMRSGLWDPETWPAFADLPDGADILECQQLLDVPAAAVRADLDRGYAEALELERTPS